MTDDSRPISLQSFPPGYRIQELGMHKERNLTIAGNWKMNKTVAAALALVNDLKIALANVTEVDIVVCPPFTALSDVAKALEGSNIRLGAQDMSEHNAGAYTGEIAAEMLKELSVHCVILGHSERRQYHQEPDALVARKARAAHAASLQPIICVGETLSQREAGHMEKVLATQLRRSLTGLNTDQMVRPLSRMNRSGPLALARQPARGKLRKPTRSSADCWSSCLTKRRRGVFAFNMAAALGHPTLGS